MPPDCRQWLFFTTCNANHEFFATADEDNVDRASITGNDTETCLKIENNAEEHESHSVDTPEGISLPYVGDLFSD